MCRVMTRATKEVAKEKAASPIYVHQHVKTYTWQQLLSQTRTSGGMSASRGSVFNACHHYRLRCWRSKRWSRHGILVILIGLAELDFFIAPILLSPKHLHCGTGVYLYCGSGHLGARAALEPLLNRCVFFLFLCVSKEIYISGKRDILRSKRG